MLTTAIVSISSSGDILRTVEHILSFHLVENGLGEFRWQRDLSVNNEGELAQYKLEFRHPWCLLGFKVPRRSRIVLGLGGEASDEYHLLYLRWQIDSSSGREICERIVRETEFEIASWLSLELRRCSGVDLFAKESSKPLQATCGVNASGF